MNKKQVRLCVLGAAGLALAVTIALVAGATSPPPPVLSAPQPRAVQAGIAWNSPWMPIARDQTLTFNHNLGGDPDDYAVELLFRDTDNNGMGINRSSYGGMEVNGQWYGAHWQNLTANTIQVYRQTDDNAADLVRIQVWAPPDPPDYEMDWMDINQGQEITLSHNLGITATDLTVGLWFSGTARGIHQFALGGLAVDGPEQMLGGHWQNLTSNTVQIVRHQGDIDIEQVRLVVIQGASPQYDSLQSLGGWQAVAAGDKYTFTHNLNWNPNLMLVRGECYDTSGLRGIHMLFAGGNHDWFGGGNFQGVSLENQTNNSVVISRLADDEFCPEVRIRIWTRGTAVYLPVVLKGSS